MNETKSLNYTLTYDTSKQKNRFNLIAIVRNEADNFQSYTIAHSLSWSEMTRVLLSWFNTPQMVNEIVARAVKNGGK